MKENLSQNHTVRCLFFCSDPCVNESAFCLGHWNQVTLKTLRLKEIYNFLEQSLDSGIKQSTRDSLGQKGEEINPEYSLEGLMLKLHHLGYLLQRADSLEKDGDAGKD